MAIPSTAPYPAAAVHYAPYHALTGTPSCVAAIVTGITSPEAVTLTLFYQQGVPAAGASAIYDPDPVAETRTAGTWHWPGDCAAQE